MVKCSNCGSEIKKPIKVWTVTLGKTKKVKITFGTFKCEKCNKKFRISIGKEEIFQEEGARGYPPPYLKMII